MGRSDTAPRGFILAEEAEGVVRLWLNRPARANALVPALLEDLLGALDEARAKTPLCLVLRAKGSAFSTGGDIGGFLEHAESHDHLRDYSARLVGLLNQAIMALTEFPAPVISVVQGPVTGGSAGFLLASDIVLMARQAFIQPYYVDIGFAPDGGWTALMPDRIGAQAALEIQYMNRRIDAVQAKAMGLAHALAPADQLDGLLAECLSVLREKETESLRATRARIWNERRRNVVAEALEEERRSFVALVGRDEVVARMKRFVRRGES